MPPLLPPLLICDWVMWSYRPLRLPTVSKVSHEGSLTNVSTSRPVLERRHQLGAELASQVHARLRLVLEGHQDGDEAVAIRLRLGHRVGPLGEDGGVVAAAVDNNGPCIWML